MTEKAIDFTKIEAPPSAGGSPPAVRLSQPYNPFKDREETRGDLARGLLWLLTFSIGGVLAFIGLGLLDGTVLTQSVFPSLIALAGTALGFYFGSQNAQDSAPSRPPSEPPLVVMPTQPNPPNSPNGPVAPASTATDSGSDASDTKTADTNVASSSAASGHESEAAALKAAPRIPDDS